MAGAACVMARRGRRDRKRGTGDALGPRPRTVEGCRAPHSTLDNDGCDLRLAEASPPLCPSPVWRRRRALAPALPRLKQRENGSPLTLRATAAGRSRWVPNGRAHGLRRRSSSPAQMLRERWVLKPRLRSPQRTTLPSSSACGTRPTCATRTRRGAPRSRTRRWRVPRRCLSGWSWRRGTMRRS